MEKITNVLKDTVSVLYWYEELSSLRLAIFGMVLRNFFFVFLRGALPPRAPCHHTTTMCVCVCVLRGVMQPSACHNNYGAMALARPLLSGRANAYDLRCCM